jgi:cytochrome c551/c552
MLRDLFDRTYSRLITGFLFALVLSFTLSFSYAQPDGAALFKNKCAQCHALTDVVIGPALKDVDKRHTEEWLIKWIKNSNDLIKAGDPAAVKLFADWKKVAMPKQDVNDADVKAILAYIKEESAKAPVVKKDTKEGPGGAKDEGTSPWTLITAIAVLGLIAYALGRVKAGLAHAIRDKAGIPHPEIVEAPQARKNWIRGNKKLIAVVLLVGFVVGSYKGWYALAGIGISQDYQPEQPIKFSHKLHAGQDKIACIYCHSGAEKSKHAGIPSVGLCMNCHKYIKEGPEYGDAEIKKIYAALDWNGTEYGKNQKPVQWTRIHNLPDLAYFNHAQHVKVGKIACQTCHGPVEEYGYDEMKQFAPLTMGWCIDCHRTTEVPGMKDNGYYNDFHKELETKYGKEAKLTVDKMGGIECARCHY